jgi:hypothetical protein
MNMQSLTSATLCLFAVACLAIDAMVSNIILWMLGLTLFITVWLRLFDLETKDQSFRAMTKK